MLFSDDDEMNRPVRSANIEPAAAVAANIAVAVVMMALRVIFPPALVVLQNMLRNARFKIQQNY